jgi:hypothetical protein
VCAWQVLGVPGGKGAAAMAKWRRVAQEQRLRFSARGQDDLSPVTPPPLGLIQSINPVLVWAAAAPSPAVS